MTDTQITRLYPDLPDELARVAVLGDTLGMAKDMELTLRDLEAAGHDKPKFDDLVARVGRPSEVESAQSTATKTIVAILAQGSEQDLQAGLDLKLLSIEDHREALTVLRTMKLQRGHSPDQERDFQA